MRFLFRSCELVRIVTRAMGVARDNVLWVVAVCFRLRMGGSVEGDVLVIDTENGHVLSIVLEPYLVPIENAEIAA